jgi:hypothetical protein
MNEDQKATNEMEIVMSDYETAMQTFLGMKQT